MKVSPEFRKQLEGYGLTTAENLCYWIAEQLLPPFGRALYRVELWETRNAYAALGEAELALLGENLRA